MIRFWSKMGLLYRVAICIIVGVGLGSMRIAFPIQVLITFGDLFGNFLRFTVPLIILMYVTVSISGLGKGSPKLLGWTIGISYTSTVLAGLAALAVMLTLGPLLLSEGSVDVKRITEVSSGALKGFMNLDIPPVMPVMTALVLAFVLGITISYMKDSLLLPIMEELSTSVTAVIENIILPFLPFYVMSLFANLTYSGQVVQIIHSFVKVFFVVLVVQWVLLFVLFCIAGAISRTNPIKMFIGMLPAYVTAIGTASSAATIPVTILSMQNNGVSEKIRNFVAPLCANIHMLGSMVEISATTVAVMMITGQSISLPQLIPFIFLLGISTVAGPGVPGGAIIAALGILETSLGFSPEMLALMLALDLAQDNFATAGNVTGDGAIALIVDKMDKNSSPA